MGNSHFRPFTKNFQSLIFYETTLTMQVLNNSNNNITSEDNTFFEKNLSVAFNSLMAPTRFF